MTKFIEFRYKGESISGAEQELKPFIDHIDAIPVSTFTPNAIADLLDQLDYLFDNFFLKLSQDENKKIWMMNVFHLVKVNALTNDADNGVHYI
jgi:hypothetical protein